MGLLGRTVLGLFAGVFLLGCTTLEPFDGPDATAAPAVEEGIWHEIEALRPDDWQTPLNVGAESLAWRLRAIDSATRSIDLQSFIWSFDDVGSLIKDRLIDAADRGVEIRILIDDSFLAGQDDRVLKLHRHPNIEYRVYNPYVRRSDGMVSRFALNLAEFDRLDHRMHNKSMVVDNQVAIVGGRNLADEYFGFDEEANFRDMELLVGGPATEAISDAFDAYWNDDWAFPIDDVAQLSLEPVEAEAIAASADALSGMFPPESRDDRDSMWRRAVSRAHSGRALLLVDDPPTGRPEDVADRPVQVAEALIRLVEEAEQEITIVSAYLIPTPPLARALSDAARRGVEVRLLTNSINSNNHIQAYAVYKSHLRDILETGADLHELKADAAIRSRYIEAPVVEKRLGLHAKYMVIDRRQAVVGSANLDPRSLRLNTEMVIVVENPSLAEEILALTEPDFEPANAWRLSLGEDGGIRWVDEAQVLDSEPAREPFQRLEAWFFAFLPIEDEM